MATCDLRFLSEISSLLLPPVTETPFEFSPPPSNTLLLSSPIYTSCFESPHVTTQPIMLNMTEELSPKKEAPICGVVNREGKICQRKGKCPFHNAVIRD